LVDGIEEFIGESIYLGVTCALERDGSLSDINFLIVDISKTNLNEYFIFPLCPFDNWMSRIDEDITTFVSDLFIMVIMIIIIIIIF
jgi:hypothetical protein